MIEMLRLKPCKGLHRVHLTCTSSENPRVLKSHVRRCKSAIKEWSLKALTRKQELLEAFGLVFVSVDAFHASRTRVDTPESLTTHFFC